MGLLDLIKDMPPPPPIPPLSKDNAVTPYSLRAITEAEQGNLKRLILLAAFGDDDDSEELRKERAKAKRLFSWAALTYTLWLDKKIDGVLVYARWLTDAVFKLAESTEPDDEMLLIDLYQVCQEYHRIIEDNHKRMLRVSNWVASQLADDRNPPVSDAILGTDCPLQEPQKKDDWFYVTKDLIREFKCRYGRCPNETEGWTQLRTEPPACYGITAGRDIGGEDAVFMDGRSLSRNAFQKRWRRYTRDNKRR